MRIDSRWLLVASFYAMAAAGSDRADASAFTYTSLNLPRFNNPVVITGIYRDQVVGYGNPVGGSGYDEGFVWTNGTVTLVPTVFQFAAVSQNGLALALPLNFGQEYAVYDLSTAVSTTYAYTNTIPGLPAFSGINSSGAISATIVNDVLKKGVNTVYRTPVEIVGGTETTILPTQKEGPSAGGISDSGTVALGCFHYCRNAEDYVNGTLTELPVPRRGALLQADNISAAGDLGGSWEFRNGQFHGGLVIKDGKAKSVNVAGAAFTFVTAIAKSGEVIGLWYDGTTDHGFILVHGKYYTIDVPGSAATVLTGISSTGSIIGYYDTHSTQGPTLPFIAQCPNGQTCTE